TWRWYLRNCWFFLKNQLRHQRITDPLQHCFQVAGACNKAGVADESDEQLDWDDSFMSFMDAKELTHLLSSRLRGSELLVFWDLCEEREIEEIASHRHLHAQTVRKIRQRIRVTVRGLGF